MSETKKIAILLPPKQKHLVPVNQAKEERIRSDWKALGEEQANIFILDHPCEEVNDSQWHPDQTQTTAMITFLNEKTIEIFGVPYVLPSATAEAMTTKNYYSKVNSLYKYGCAACNSKLQNQCYFLCDLCKEASGGADWMPQMVADFRARVEEINQEESPPLVSLDFSHLSDGEELPCPVCASVFTKVSEFKKHYDQLHPQEKEKSLRDKAKFSKPV